MNRSWLAATCLVVVAAVLCLGAVGFPSATGHSIRAVVTIAPLKGLIEPLLPPGSTVTVLMKPGKSEHGYEFTPADIAAMAEADLFVYVGLNLEGRIEGMMLKQKAPNRQVVCFASEVGIKAPEGQGEDHDADRHDDHEDHDEHVHGPGYIDPHLWLDPVLVRQLVPALKNAVVNTEQVHGTIDEAERQRLNAAEKDLITRIDAVDKDWADQFKPLRGKSVVTHHNAFGRPAERYGFRIAAVIREFETSEPTPGDLAKVVEAIRKENVGVIFVEPQFSSAAADRIVKMAKVRKGVLDPLGDGDWFKLMKTNLDSLVTNLSDGSTAGGPATPKVPPPEKK